TSASSTLLRLELDLLIRRRPRIVQDESEARLGHARTVPTQGGELPQWEIHGLVVDQLLDAVQERLALLWIELGRLLLEEVVDVGISAVRVRAARGREHLEPGGGVAGDTTQAVDEVAELLLLIRGQEPGALDWPQPRLDSDRLQVVEDRLGA